MGSVMHQLKLTFIAVTFEAIGEAGGGLEGRGRDPIIPSATFVRALDGEHRLTRGSPESSLPSDSSSISEPDSLWNL